MDYGICLLDPVATMMFSAHWTLLSLQLHPALWWLFHSKRRVQRCILDVSVLPCPLGQTRKAHLCLRQNSYQKSYFTFFLLWCLFTSALGISFPKGGLFCLGYQQHHCYTFLEVLMIIHYWRLRVYIRNQMSQQLP